MKENEVIEFRCKKCGRHFWDYLIQNDDDLLDLFIGMQVKTCIEVSIWK